MDNLERWWRKIAYAKVRTSNRSTHFLFLLSLLYRISSATKKFFFAQLPFLRTRVRNPLIVIGNLTVGGSGKTPLVLGCLQRYLSMNERVHLISRGYGAKFPGSFAYYTNHQWNQGGFFGDELELCVDRFPEIEASVGKRRAVLVGEVGKSDPHKIIILDDALQYWRLEQDFRIITIHGSLRFGNGEIFPSGPLRENPRELRRANIIVIHNPCETYEFYEEWIQEFIPGKPPLFLSRPAITSLVDREGAVVHPAPFNGIKVVCACAIAHPEPFFQEMRELGMEICGTFSFRDHHQFTENEQQLILKTKEELGASYLVLTEKDKPRWNQVEKSILFARQELKIENEKEFFEIIDGYIQRKRQIK